MSRNQGRIPTQDPNIQNPEAKAEVNNNPFNFVVPTEIVDLPSKGKFYPPGHPLRNKESIEIKHMTAKEEDILTSVTLLKKGVALDKVIQSIIIDKQIRVEDLLIGDKNALLVASRRFGYGPNYEVNLDCPSCASNFKHTFDLDLLENKNLDNNSSVETTENATFVTSLPRSEFEIEFKLLTSKDESGLTGKNAGTLSLLNTITVSINGQTDLFYIQRALQSLPILDTTMFKKRYVSVMPDVEMTQTVECTECGESSQMEVPLNADFFWPNI